MSAILNTEIGYTDQNCMTGPRSFDLTIILIYFYQFTKKSDKYKKGWPNAAKVINIKPRQMELAINKNWKTMRSWFSIRSIYGWLKSEITPNLVGYQIGPMYGWLKKEAASNLAGHPGV